MGDRLTGGEPGTSTRLGYELMDIIRKEEAEGRATRPSTCNESAPANARQHGGDHYKGTGFEHWDFVHGLGLDYFQGNSTKYVSRWRNKGGHEDLLKAIHYVDKARELDKQSDMAVIQRDDWQNVVYAFCLANHIRHMEYLIIWHIVQRNWGDARALLEDLETDHRPKIART